MDEIFEKLYKNFQEEQYRVAFIHTNDRSGFIERTKENLYRICVSYSEAVNPIVQQDKQCQPKEGQH